MKHHVCLYVYRCVCVYVWMYVIVYVGMCVCVFCVYVCAFSYVA